MTSEQISSELNALLTLLNDQQVEIKAVQEKFRIALTGVLRLFGDGSPTLANLQGNPEDLKGYLLQLNSEISETMTKSYQSLQKRIEHLIEIVAASDRKS